MVYASDIDRGKGKYCSRSCWDKDKRVLAELIRCAYCNQAFKNVHSKRNRRFCNKYCYTKYQAGRPCTPNLVGKRGIKPRGFKKTSRDKHGSAVDVEWRMAVFTRDDYTCLLCGKQGGRLQAHHIKPFKKYPEFRHVVSNGQTLCVRCHKKTDTYGWANYWKSQIAEDRLRQEELF